MSQHGAALQTFNVELVKTVEELKRRQAVLSQEVVREQQLKGQLQQELNKLQSELDAVCDRLEKKERLATEYARIVSESDHAYQKILDSSQALLSVVKQESSLLCDTTKFSPGSSPNLSNGAEA